MSAILKTIFHQLVAEINVKHKRFLYDELSPDSRLLGIVGGRGVGKTTLMLQHIKNNFDDLADVFYFSADHIYFNSNTIVEYVHGLYFTEGVKAVYIDEIHKYQNWNQELKNIYDSYPNLKIVFSGSSSLDIVKGSYDLSRRAILYPLPGMSLREYINFTTGSQIPAYSYNDLIENYMEIGAAIGKIPKLISLFRDYLKQGYYPFYYETPLSYYERILRIIEKTIHEDIANFYNYKTLNLQHFKKVLYYLASMYPGKINVHNIARHLSIDDKTILKYLTSLQETGLIQLIYPQEGGNVGLRRPEKIFLNNTNLQYALEDNMGPNIEIGSIRELYFIQSLRNADVKVYHSKIGDYAVGDSVFEVGGKNKTRKQIKAVENAFLIKDDILYPSRNVIPLMYFGFLY